MRKIFFIIALAVLFQGTFLSAQSTEFFKQSTGEKFAESEFYYFSFPIEKIYTHRLGFMVLYRRNSNAVSRTFIPHEWFQNIGGTGEIVYLGTGKEWPSMIVYYRNGEFSHVRLRVRQNRLHETWGVIPFNVAADQFFEDIEEVKLEH